MSVWRRYCDTLKHFPEERRSLAIVGVAGPVIALIGTLCGIVRLSCLIAMNGTAVTPGELIDDILFSLAVTLVGMAIAAPIILAYSAICRSKERH
jgi:biopolymer transport protein ExbB/TolQ